jgi:hypothetical protein
MTDMEEMFLALEEMRWLKEIWGRISFDNKIMAIELVMARLERIKKGARK